MWFELRISGGEHVSGEWATGSRIIVLHSREIQEGPGTGTKDTLTQVIVVLGMNVNTLPVFLRFKSRDAAEDKLT